MSIDPDEIAKRVIDRFEALPDKCKPRVLDNGKREWVPLAGIVVVRSSRDNIARHDEAAECVALATGMKCLPRDKIELANGNIIHDWHAEILALRAFNRWILDECYSVATGATSLWFELREDVLSQERLNDNHIGEEAHPEEEISLTPPFRLHANVDIHMYVSAAPCGDASMELTMRAQSDTTPWTRPPPSAREGDLPGRAHFDQLGVVRRKPSRPDAPSTWSKSCTDKLAMKQCTGLLSAAVATLVEPSNIYLKSLVIPQQDHVPTAVERAFGPSGRMAALSESDIQASWQKLGLAYHPFTVRGTTQHFKYEKVEGAVPSNLALAWMPQRQELLINGVLQGRKQFDHRGMSSMARRSMFQAVVDVLASLGVSRAARSLRNSSYTRLKRLTSRTRGTVKADVKLLALRNWKENTGDDAWSLVGPK